jgi:hypothetical protein
MPESAAPGALIALLLIVPRTTASPAKLPSSQNNRWTKLLIKELTVRHVHVLGTVAAVASIPHTRVSVPRIQGVALAAAEAELDQVLYIIPVASIQLPHSGQCLRTGSFRIAQGLKPVEFIGAKEPPARRFVAPGP